MVCECFDVERCLIGIPVVNKNTAPSTPTKPFVVHRTLQKISTKIPTRRKECDVRCLLVGRV